jgi:hypothetical protein
MQIPSTVSTHAGAMQGGRFSSLTSLFYRLATEAAYLLILLSGGCNESIVDCPNLIHILIGNGPFTHSRKNLNFVINLIVVAAKDAVSVNVLDGGREEEESGAVAVAIARKGRAVDADHGAVRENLWVKEILSGLNWTSLNCGDNLKLLASTGWTQFHPGK